VIAQAAATNLIPPRWSWRQEPEHLLRGHRRRRRRLFDKAIEGLVLFAFNQGEVCTCPSRALIQESIYDKFMRAR
jgi:aldehyde dehydrogenase